MKHISVIASLIFSVFVNAQAPAIQWQKCLGGTGLDFAFSSKQTSDGGYIIAGRSASNDGNVSGNNGGNDCWVVKLSSTGAIQWQKSYGGTSAETVSEILQTSDGGYIFSATTSSNNGNVTSNAGLTDYWIVKLDNLGNIQWQKTYGGVGNDNASSMQQTNDGGYVVVGNSNSPSIIPSMRLDDYWIIKLSSLGVVQWQKTYGGSDYELARAIQQTSDNGYIIAGVSSSTNGNVTGNHGLSDFWIVKTNSLGTLQWQKSFGGSNGDGTEDMDIKQTFDKGYIVVGNSSSNNGNITGNNGGEDYWIVKLDSVGALVWQKNLGGSNDDYATAVQQTVDSGYIVAGTSSSFNGDVVGNHGVSDLWVVKLSSNGTFQWQKSLGSSTLDEANAIEKTSDGGFIVAGVASSSDGDVSGGQGNFDYWIAKLAPSPLPLKFLSFTAQKVSSNILLNWQTANEINVSHINIQSSINDKDFISIGKVDAACCAYHFVDSKFSSFGGVGVVYYRLEIVDKDGNKQYSKIKQVTIRNEQLAINISPNPARDIVNISCKANGQLVITNNLGREVKTQVLTRGNNAIDITKLSRGIYMVNVITNQEKVTQKLVVQ